MARKQPSNNWDLEEHKRFRNDREAGMRSSTVHGLHAADTSQRSVTQN